MIRFTFIFILILCTSAYAEIKGDINDDDMVNATEAIYALQVTAGVRQQLTSNEMDGHSLNAADGSPVNALYVDNDGKIGIGTENPLASLTVRGNLNYSKELSGHVMILKDSNRVIGAETFFTEELRNGDSISIDGNYYIVQEVIGDRDLLITSNVNKTLVEKKIYIADDLFQVQNANSETKLILDTKGNVGIGISNPGAKLDINGTMIRKIFRNSSWSSLDTAAADVAVFDYKKAEPVQIPNKTLTVKKLKDETSIKVEYSDYMGVWDSCGRCVWEIRVDGESCPNQPLYFSSYNCIHTSTGNSRSLFFHNLKGYCEGLESGTHEIQVWVNVDEGYASSNPSFMCRTGTYKTTWTIEAQEVY